MLKAGTLLWVAVSLSLLSLILAVALFWVLPAGAHPVVVVLPVATGFTALYCSVRFLRRGVADGRGTVMVGIAAALLGVLVALSYWIPLLVRE